MPPLGSSLTGYHFARRLTEIISPAGAFGYHYNPGQASLTAKISLPGSAYITNQFDTSARLLSTILCKSDNSALNAESYIYNRGDQRTNQVPVSSFQPTIPFTWRPIRSITLTTPSGN